MQDKCSFCGRSRDEVDLLISGVDGFICDMCATQAYDIVQEEQKNHTSSLNLDQIENKKTDRDQGIHGSIRDRARRG